MRKAFFMETTTIDPGKTLAELQELLARRNARSVLVEYENGTPEGLAFKLRVADQDIPFKLPCRWRNLEALLKKSGRHPRKSDTWESWARRMAWRQILRWVEAQLALIDTGMVKPEEVFLPYACVGEKTMYEFIEEKKFLALPAPSEAKGSDP